MLGRRNWWREVHNVLFLLRGKRKDGPISKDKYSGGGEGLGDETEWLWTYRASGARTFLPGNLRVRHGNIALGFHSRQVSTRRVISLVRGQMFKNKKFYFSYTFSQLTGR